MAKYLVKEKSYIVDHIVEAGEIVDYEGEVSGNLELVKPSKEGTLTLNKANADTKTVS